MHHPSKLSRHLACALLAAGCGSYEPRPLDEQKLCRDLQAIRLEALQPSPEASPPGAPPAFDYQDGLSADEAVLVALFMNPDLRAFRKERGVAEGELVAAGLLSNPELQVTWMHIEHFTHSLATSGFDVGLNWAPPRPGELDARQSKARARIEEVKARVSDEEWQLASLVRETYASLLAAAERLRLAESSMRLEERLQQFIRDKRQLGDASQLDVNLVDIEVAGIAREAMAVKSERDGARLELNRLLGLPPRYELKLQSSGEPLELSAFRLDAETLERELVARRPDLAAWRQKYEQCEQSLRLAYIQRWPWFRFGPAYARDEIEGQPGNRWGIGLGVDLPLVNQNQGEIARLEAEREMARDHFVALLHRARSEVHEALRNLEARARMIRFFEETVRPSLDENVRLTEAGFQAGELNLLQVITTQEKSLQSRREAIQTRLEYWRAVHELEKSVGARLRDVETEKGKME